MPRELIVSPRGEALWAKVLGEPDAYEDNPRAWSITLLLDPEDPETIAFVERLEAEFVTLHGKTDKVATHGWPFGEETTKDDKGRPVKTGKLKFNFKRKEATSKGNIKSPPMVVDAKKNLWPTETLIGNGSKVKVAFSCWGWSGPSGKGMSMELESLQVLELVSYDRPTATDAFAEEDGYVVETPAPAPEKEPSFAEKLKARAAEVQSEAAELPF